MTARHYEEQMIEEGQASLDAYEASVVPIEHARLQTLESAQIEAAKVGIKLLFEFILDLEGARVPTCELAEIGEALIGGGEVKRLREIEVAYSRVAPNWYEKVCLARDQDKMLRQTTRLIQLSLATLENDIYATRVANASQYLEDALVDLDEYKMEGDPEQKWERPSYRIPDSEKVIWEGEETTWGHLSQNERMMTSRNIDGVLEGADPF